MEASQQSQDKAHYHPQKDILDSRSIEPSDDLNLSQISSLSQNTLSTKLKYLTAVNNINKLTIDSQRAMIKELEKQLAIRDDTIANL